LLLLFGLKREHMIPQTKALEGMNPDGSIV
ncbi:MAG: hypothetical protein RLZZ422_2367, partial [Pseudomonadota bacterium]|jgi:hypothetical protein